MTTRTPARLAAAARNRLDRPARPREDAACAVSAVRGAVDRPLRIVAAQLKAMPRAPWRVGRRGLP